MKTNTVNAIGLSFFFVATMSLGCQKAEIKKIAAVQPTTVDSEQLTSNGICSNEILELSAGFSDFQRTTLDFYNQNKSLSEKTLQDFAKMDQSSQKKCAALIQQFNKENVSSCFRSETSKAKENKIEKIKVDAACTASAEWFKKMTRPKDKLKDGEKKLAFSTLRFSELAAELIQNKSASAFNYVSDGEVKIGLDSFKQDLLANAPTCAFVAAADLVKKDSVYKVVSEMPTSSLDLNFDFKGSQYSLALEDSDHAMLSMTCFNVNFDVNPDKKAVLQKVFGSLITFEKNESVEPSENQVQDESVKPTAQTSTPKKEIKSEKDESQKKNNEAVDDLFAKAKANLHEVVQDTLAEVKKTTEEARKETIQEVKKAAEDLSAATIESAKVAAQDVSKQSIADAKVAVIEASKEVIQQAKTAVIDTVMAPVLYAREKVTDGIEYVVDTSKSVFSYLKQKASSVKKIFSSASGTSYDRFKDAKSETAK